MSAIRINQIAKEYGVGNSVILELLETRMGVTGKSHSSGLNPSEESTVRRILDAKSKGQPEQAPLAVHKPSAAVKVVKAKGDEAPRLEAPKPEVKLAPKAEA